MICSTTGSIAPISGCNCYACNSSRGCLPSQQAKKPATFRLDLSLIPGFFIRALAPCFMLGESKYARGDWKNACKNKEQAEEAVNRRMTSLLNHLTSDLDGIEYDDEGPAHLAAVAWNALYILFLRATFFCKPPFNAYILQMTLETNRAKKIAQKEG